MASELKVSMGVQTRLVEGNRGIFDIKIDGNLIYSKAETHRFPDPGEVSSLIQGK